MIRRTAQALVAVCFVLGLIGELQRQEDIELVREQRALYLENRNAE